MPIENKPDYIQPDPRPKKPFSNDEVRKTRQDPSFEMPEGLDDDNKDKT